MPERPAALQRLPQGLLGFFDLKSGGKYPASLVEQLAPTIDLGKWYLNTNESSVAVAPIAIAGVGFTTFVTTGDRTYIERFSMMSDVLGAGDTFVGCAAYAIDLATTVKFFQVSDIFTATTGDQVLISNRNPFFLPPASALGLFTMRFLGGYNFQAFFTFNALPD